MSKPISVVIPHALGVAEAKRRLETGFGDLGKAIPGGMCDAHQAWDGDRATFTLQAMGQVLTGRLEVLVDRILLEVDLPGILVMLANQVRTGIEKQGRLLLGKR